MKETPENVRIRADAAAKCTKVIKRRVLKKQTRKGRADHLVECRWMAGRRKIKRKPCQSCMSMRTSRKSQRKRQKRVAKTL